MPSEKIHCNKKSGRLFWKALLFLFTLTLAACTVWLIKQKNELDSSPTPYLYFAPFHNQREFYQNFIDTTQAIPDPNTNAVIVNHHLLAGNFIANAFYTISTNEEITLVIISPDHFFNNQNTLETTDLSWITAFGTLKADEENIQKLVNQNLLTINRNGFKSEHGIGNIVTFAKHYLPNAKLIPLTVNESLGLEKTKMLAKTLTDLLPQNTIYVGSFDFSHYLPKYIAELHDTFSLNVLETFSLEQIQNLDVDSHSGLAFFLSSLKELGFQDFKLLEHANSEDFLDQKDIQETTSYITGKFLSGEKKHEKLEAVLIFGGLASGIPAKHLSRFSPDYSFEYLERIFLGQNINYSFTRLPKSFTSFGTFSYITTTQANVVEPFSTSPQIIIKNGKDCGENIFHETEHSEHVIICNKNISSIKIPDSQNILLTNLGFLDPLAKKEDNQAYPYMIYLLSKQDETQIHLLPFTCKNKECKLLIGTERDIVLKEISKNLLAPEQIKRQAKTGDIKIKK